MKKLPRYTEVGRYPYHFACTKILPDPRKEGEKIQGPKWMIERTHGCWCSSWRQNEDGTFMQWRNGRWMRPIKGSIKSKPISEVIE